MEGKAHGRPMAAVGPVLAYCLCSMAMIFTNKLVLSVYDFPHAATLLLLQSAIAVASLKVLGDTGIIKLEAFSLETALLWSPVTFFFALMLYTGSMTIAFLSIPVLTVFKNMTNLFIAAGDWYFFGQTVTVGIVVSFAMMTLGSALVGYTDLEFNLPGYVWMACNCLAQTGYVLYMRRAKGITKLSEWGMSMYNNLLCMPIMAIAAASSGEIEDVLAYPHLLDFKFLSAMIFSGLIGTGLSLSVFWCVSATSPTTYSMVGALNKIPITFVSVVFFNVHLDWKLTVSICIGLASGLVYTYAKLQPKKSHIVKDARSLEEGRPR